MADDERLTKAEKREQRRQARIEEEERQAAAASRARIRNAGIGALSVVVIGGLVFLAVGNSSSPDLAGAVTLSVDEGVEAQAAAGCEIVDDDALPDRVHYEPGDVPPAEELYTDGRPTNSGSHYVNPQGVVTGASNRQLDEYATTHNLEHGSIIVWYDPEQVDAATIGEIDEWVTVFNEAGFANEFSGAGLFASPYTDPGIDSGKALALRAWGVSMDCDTWDETAANAFTIDHFGTHGISPEANLGPYPGGVLGYEDQEAEDGEDIDADDVGEMAPTDTETDDGE